MRRQQRRAREFLEPADNVCAAAKGLRAEKGAPPTCGSYESYYQAACGYYGACRDAASHYAPEVMARAGVGKTLMARELGVVLARGGARVLLID